MTRKMIRQAYYPRNTTLHESLAMKVITRVVSDGISLRNAVREAIKIAELNKKDIFVLMSVLQDYGMVHNGDYKNYWANGWGEGVGKEGVDTNLGTNYYAKYNGKTVTAEDKNTFELFDQIEKLRAFASDEEIISCNPELEEVITAMNKTDKVVAMLNSKEAEVDIPETFFQKSFKKAIDTYNQRKKAGMKKPFEEIFYEVAGPEFKNINWERLTPLIKKYIPEYESLSHVQTINSSLNKQAWEKEVSEVEDPSYEEDVTDLEEAFGLSGIPYEKHSNSTDGQRIITAQEAGKGLESLPQENELANNDLNVEEPEVAPVQEDLTVEEPEVALKAVNVEVTPTPEELMKMAKEGPQWEIKNMLSINKAEEYYNQLKKELEAVVFNPNIKMDLNGIAEYDKVRNMIDSELNKIKEATKGKEKIEKKEEKLQEEMNSPESEINVEEPEKTVEPKEEAKVQPSGLEEAEPNLQG